MERTEEPRMGLQERAMMKMEERYGVAFEYSGPWGDSLSGTHSFYVTTESIPDHLISVQIENFRYPERVFLNNFLAVKHRDATIDFLHSRVTEVFNDTRIFYNVSDLGLSPDLPADATLYEFLADTRVRIVVMAEVKESDFTSEDQAMKVAELIAESGVNFILTLVVVDDESFGTHTRETLGRRVALFQVIDCASISHRDGIINIIWDREE